MFFIFPLVEVKWIHVGKFPIGCGITSAGRISAPIFAFSSPFCKDENFRHFFLLILFPYSGAVKALSSA